MGGIAENMSEVHHAAGKVYAAAARATLAGFVVQRVLLGRGFLAHAPQAALCGIATGIDDELDEYDFLICVSVPPYQGAYQAPKRGDASKGSRTGICREIRALFAMHGPLSNEEILPYLSENVTRHYSNERALKKSICANAYFVRMENREHAS